MFCPNCGRTLPHNDFTQCPSCGARLTPPVANAPAGSDLELPQRPSPYAETALSQQGQASQQFQTPHGQQTHIMPLAAGGYGQSQQPQQQWIALPQPAMSPNAAYPQQAQYPPMGGYGYPQQPAPVYFTPVAPVYSQPPNYAPPGYPLMYQPQQSPQPPRRRASTPIIIGSVIAILVLLIVTVLGVFALRNGFVPGFTNLHQGA